MRRGAQLEILQSCRDDRAQRRCVLAQFRGFRRPNCRLFLRKRTFSAFKTIGASFFSSWVVRTSTLFILLLFPNFCLPASKSGTKKKTVLYRPLETCRLGFSYDKTLNMKLRDVFCFSHTLSKPMFFSFELPSLSLSLSFALCDVNVIVAFFFYRYSALSMRSSFTTRSSSLVRQQALCESWNVHVVLRDVRYVIQKSLFVCFFFIENALSRGTKPFFS